MKIKKERWSPKEIAVLKCLSDMGMGHSEIGVILGRTACSVASQKNVHRIFTKKKAGKFSGLSDVDVPVEKVVKSSLSEAVAPLVDLKNPSKEISRIARQIARENGKRITMAMFFVEDFV